MKRDLRRNPPPPEPQGSGDFTAGAPVYVPKGRMLVCFANPAFAAVLTAEYHNGKTITYPTFQGVGFSQRFSSQMFHSVAPSAPDPNVTWFLVPDAQPPFESQGRLGTIKVSGVFDTDFGANTTFFTPDLLPFNPPCIFRLYVMASVGTVFSVKQTNIGLSDTITVAMNSGNALVAGAGYIFDIEVDPNDSINFVVSIEARVTLRVYEVDNQS